MTNVIGFRSIALGLLAASVGASGCTGASAAQDHEARVERGKYLVTVAGCNDCHTPLKMGPNGPEPDLSRALSGHPEHFKIAAAPASAGEPWMMNGAATMTAFAGPWGVSFAANLTPDENTGIGIWSEELFIKTLRTGRHWGTSRAILPPMPWQNFSQMTDADLKAIYAYLRTIKPVVNHVPTPIEPPPSLARVDVGGAASER
jgi:mono/diheme cytochrome c family protein